MHGGGGARIRGAVGRVESACGWLQVRDASERAADARAQLVAAQAELAPLRQAAVQQEELLAQVAALRCCLSETQADVAAREDELAAARAALERQVCRPACMHCMHVRMAQARVCADAQGG
jgi:hypothetical protein